MYTVTLTNDSMPQHDDAAYDTPFKKIFVKKFDEKKEAKKFFKSFANEHRMRIFYNEAAGNGKVLNCNF